MLKVKKVNQPLKKVFIFLFTLIFMVSIVVAESSVAFAASLKTPKIKSATAKSSTSISVKWKKVSGVSGYIIYQKKGNGNYKKVKVIEDDDSTSYTKKNLSSATKYSYKVKAYKVRKGKKTYSAKSSAKSTYTKPSTPEITSIKSLSKTTIKLKWEKISKADGYAIYRKSGDDYIKIATVKSKKTTSYTIKNLKSGKKYTYLVRSYFNANGKKIYSSKSEPEGIYTNHTHKYSKKITKPTCIKKGYTTYKCFCGKSYKSDYKNPTHTYKNYVCTKCDTVDKSHAYEYLKDWVIINGEVDGSYIQIDEMVGDTLYGINYSANADYIYIDLSYYNSYDDFSFNSLYLNNYEYFSCVGEEITDDYIAGKINPSAFTTSSPLTYTDSNDTYYNSASLAEAARSNICDMLYWLDDLLEREDLGITIADLGFKSFK